MQGALGKPKDALRKLDLLLHDQQWASRAQLRAAELYIDLGDAPNARRLLAEMKPTTIAERRERRALRGRLELISLNDLSIAIRPTRISLFSSKNWMSCIAPSTNPRAMNWRNGCAGRNSPGEHLHDGISLDWKSVPDGGSERRNYFPTCDARASNRRR